MDPCIMQTFQRKLACSICRNCFVDPITIDCGHSFCRPCFYLNWQNTSVLAHCSECQEAVQQKDFKTNVTLKQMVFIFRQTILWQPLYSMENLCRIHMEAKQIFCEDQRSLLCLYCSTFQEHEAHRHWSVEYAAEQYREKLLNTMSSLWEKCCDNDRNLNLETVTTSTWVPFVITKVRAIRTIYDNLPQYFYLETEYYIMKLLREGKCSFEQLKYNKARMEYKRELLRGMYTELKEMCHKPDVELLLDFGEILHRSEAVCMHMPQPLKPELTVEINKKMIETLNFFKGIINLQHGSTPSHVFLQGDLINLSVGCCPQGAPYTSSLSECFYDWDDQTFTSGIHYWEIEVGDNWNWALGVSCYDWIEKNIHIQEAFYLLGCAKTEMHHNVFSTSPPVLQYVPKPIGRVGVFLNYEGKSVTFVNVATSSILCRIARCSFSPHLRPIFCCSHF